MSFDALILAADRAAQALLGGVVVSYKPAISPAVNVTGIFDAQYVLAKGSAEAGVEATGPAVFFRFSDLPVDPESDDPILTINGLTYSVTERRPDGLGGIVLVLRRS
jgi:hypothetical protein